MTKPRGGRGLVREDRVRLYGRSTLARSPSCTRTTGRMFEETVTVEKRMTVE